MKHKKTVIFISILILLIAVSGIGWHYYFSEPDPFLPEEMIIDQINEYHQLEVAEIQEIIFLDEQHVVVFFISTDEMYAQAFWKWQDNDWLLSGHNAMGSYTVWNLNESDLYLIWNVRPDPTLSYVEIIGQRERQYRTTRVNKYYYPALELTKRIYVESEKYGVEEISGVWKEVIVDLQQTSDQVDDFLTISSPPTEVTFGWVPYGSNEKILSVDDYAVSAFGSRFGGGIKPILRLTEDELQ